MPLPTGGCASAACRMVHTISSIRALSCRSDNTAETTGRMCLLVEVRQSFTSMIYFSWFLAQISFRMSLPKFQASIKENKTVCEHCALPSSPCTGSSRRSSVIHSQSFSSSWELSHNESTKYAACSWSYTQKNLIQDFTVVVWQLYHQDKRHFTSWAKSSNSHITYAYYLFSQ